MLVIVTETVIYGTFKSAKIYRMHRIYKEIKKYIKYKIFIQLIVYGASILEYVHLQQVLGCPESFFRFIR